MCHIIILALCVDYMVTGSVIAASDLLYDFWLQYLDVDVEKNFDGSNTDCSFTTAFRPAADLG